MLAIASCRAELVRLENLILQGLAESSSDTILDNEQLIVTLETCKTKGAQIGEILAAAEETEASINATRDAYRAVSLRGSVLYFVIKDLALIDPMYQNSLG